MGSIVLLDLMGGVALLLWGLHMVLSGVLRAFGPDLRRFLGKALRNRFTAFGAGLGFDGGHAEQHRDRADDRVARSRRRGQLGAGAGDHAGRECRHDADRPGSLLQRLGGGAGPVRHRSHHLPRRRSKSHPRPWPHRHRPRPDAFGAAYSGRHAGAGRAGAGGAGASRLHHQRSDPVHHDRGGADLGGAFERRRCAPGDVARLFTLRHRRGGARLGARRQSRQRDQSAA